MLKWQITLGWSIFATIDTYTPLPKIPATVMQSVCRKHQHDHLQLCLKHMDSRCILHKDFMTQTHQRPTTELVYVCVKHTTSSNVRTDATLHIYCTALWTVVVEIVHRSEDKEETGSPLEHTISQLCLNKDINFVFTLRWHINGHILCSTNCLHEVHRRGLFNCWTPCCVESIWDWMKCFHLCRKL